jgi:L-fucose isomerase-like protein
LLHDKAILGIFDEGCMGMYNAIVDDESMNRIGIFKERLSQSSLYARMQTVSEEDAQSVHLWLIKRGIHFMSGVDEAAELTEGQILLQCKMYIACLRIAQEFGCDAVGIQHQQGLKDLVPASDLVEGLLNNPDRPPVFNEDGIEIFAAMALPHFNELDECAGIDALITNRCWRSMGFDLSTTLHDVRWGETYSYGDREEFVWLWQISGAAPSGHFVGGYSRSISQRQPAMYFPLGGGTLEGIGRPGSVVWSRIFIEEGTLYVDRGLAKVITLPHAETTRRWNEVTSQWPMLSVIIEGVSRDQFMARHRSNHVSIAYAPIHEEAKRALNVKAALVAALGVQVYVCGIDQD